MGYFFSCKKCNSAGHASTKEGIITKAFKDICPSCESGNPRKPVIDETFGKQLRELRINSDLSFRQVSDGLGVGIVVYCEIERGVTLISESEQKRFINFIKAGNIENQMDREDDQYWLEFQKNNEKI